MRSLEERILISFKEILDKLSFSANQDSQVRHEVYERIGFVEEGVKDLKKLKQLIVEKRIDMYLLLLCFNSQNGVHIYNTQKSEDHERLTPEEFDFLKNNLRM